MRKTGLGVFFFIFLIFTSFFVPQKTFAASEIDYFGVPNYACFSLGDGNFCNDYKSFRFDQTIDGNECIGVSAECDSDPFCPEKISGQECCVRAGQERFPADFISASCGISNYQSSGVCVENDPIGSYPNVISCLWFYGSPTSTPTPTSTPIPPTPTITPTPIPVCSNYTNCNGCTTGAPNNCGWTGSSCVTGSSVCPAGFSEWYWSVTDCPSIENPQGNNRCAAPPTPTPTRTPTPTITLTPSPTPATYRIEGAVYIDTNQNGIHESPGELGYGGATVTVFITALTTASNGVYTYYTSDQGTYPISVTVPSGYTATTSTSTSVNLGPGNPVANAWFGIVPVSAPTLTPTPTPTPGGPTPTSAPTPTPSNLANGSGCSGNNQCASNFCQNLTTCAACTSAPNNCNIGTCVNGVCVIPPTPTPTPSNYTSCQINYYPRDVCDVDPTTGSSPTGCILNNPYSVDGVCRASGGGGYEKTTLCSSCTPDPTSTPTPTPTPTLRNISGRVFYDDNGNGLWDSTPTDRPYDGAGGANVTITGNPGPNTYFINLVTSMYQTSNIYVPGNSYTVDLNNIPAPCTTPPLADPKTITMPDANTFVHFPLQGCPAPTPTPTYSISGKIFNDANPQDGLSANESNYTNSAAIDISPNLGSLVNSGGDYTFSGLPSGEYTITFSGLPSGFSFTYPPDNLGENSLIVTVGSGCSYPVTSEAACSLGNITNLNAGVTNNASSWFQSIGTDIRLDSGYDYILPSGKYASIAPIGGTPGIIFSGQGKFHAGDTQASANNWKVESSNLGNDIFTQGHALIPTSYIFILETAQGSGIIPNNIAAFCGVNGIASCDLDSSFLNGIYIANEDLTLQGGDYEFASGKNFIILVNGNLNIKHRIRVPPSSTVIFSAKGDIKVDQSVGETASASCNTTTHAGCTIEGVYSADHDFIADGIENNCPTAEPRLNIAGSVIANAGRESSDGGDFENKRSLCGNNADYPSVTFIERPDFIINFPNLIQQSTRIWQEVAP